MGDFEQEWETTKCLWLQCYNLLVTISIVLHSPSQVPQINQASGNWFNSHALKDLETKIEDMKTKRR